ncbi:MAG: inositol phosphate phosphatase SopB [Pseudomonadota bacterium]
MLPIGMPYFPDPRLPRSASMPARATPAAALPRAATAPQLDSGSMQRARDNFLRKFCGRPAEPDPGLADMVRLRQQRMDSVELLLANAPQSFADPAATKLAFADLRRELESIEPDQKSFKKCEKTLIDMLAGQLACSTPAGKMPRQEAKLRVQLATKLYREGVTAQLNQQPWHTIERHLNLPSAQGPTRYASTLTPAAQMKLGEHNIFETDYHGQGVACGSTKSTNHATNLWLSEFHAADGQPLFRGVRHGICSPYGLKNKTARQSGALNRAREVATAALFLDQHKLERALQGETVALQLSSTSLVTAVNIAGETEGRQFGEQLKAWHTLGAQQPCVLPIRDGNGVLRQVKVKLEVAAFNFGVNEAALNLKVGWGDADKQNKQALHTLLGDELHPGGIEGGWVGRYLSAQPAHPNAALVAQLSGQIRAIWDHKSHRSDGGEPYKMAQRIAMLSHEIGVVPCYNCKSGKDRTGMLDSELKREAVQLHQGAGLSSPGEKLDPQQQNLLRAVLGNSGNLDIQIRNTGAPGNKVLKKESLIGNNLSLRARIGDRAAFARNKGLSGLVKS